MPNDRVKALLADLGRSTLRGVRKCPKCGTLNGIRGLMCKNKACDRVFREAGDRRKNSTEVCKLVTGTTTQVFSVRVRDKGPDYRGFVQLPLQSQPRDSLINQPSAVCFVESCQRVFNTNILKCHERELQPVTLCQHVLAATRCFASAHPIEIFNNAIFSLNIPNHMKQTVWQLALSSFGPLVQRVSKTIMAVKCKVTSKQPLGYLHATFNPLKAPAGMQGQFICGCPTFKGQGFRGQELTQERKCLHYYACIAAFAGDEKLSEEFACFVDQERAHEIVLSIQDEPHQIIGLDESGASACDESGGGGLSAAQVVAVLHDIEPQLDRDEDEECVMQRFIVSTTDCDVDADNLVQVGEFEPISETIVPDLCLQELEVLPDLLPPDLLASDKLDSPLKLFTNPKPNSGKRKKTELTIPLISGVSEPKKCRKPVKPPKPYEVKEESSVDQSFVQWLATVTERINQQMHYQFTGKPAPLVFHTPQVFFDCLRERISYGGKKKRLPNTTTAFVRKHAVPLGTFTKYTWHINNIIHCKQIFETPLMPLEITRSFVENQDGTYDDFVSTDTNNEAYSKIDNNPRIRPLELKTFLKVGITSPNQKVPTPMIIEWIPDILPKTKVGELKITFEFGHRRP